MKLTILGGGGFRVPLVFKALARDTSPQRVTELRLHDTDPVRLRVIDVVLAQLAPTLPHPPEVVATTDLPRALEGTDFIFSALSEEFGFVGTPVHVEVRAREKRKNR